MKFKNKIMMLIGVGLLSALCLQAQNIIRPKISGPNGLYVNSYNGVLFFGQTDLETQNTQMPMQLRFYYNSSANQRNYGYGLGFSLGYEMRYTVNEIGGVTIETGDGRTDTYTKYGKDFEAPAGVFSVLIEYEANKYCLTEKTGEKYYFDDPKYGKLTGIEDRYGNKTTLTYQDSLLVKVEDAVGHKVEMSYSDGLLKVAKASFHAGTISYEYDGLHRLKKRTDAMGNVTLYGYNNQNRIDEITDANGHKTLIAYNSAGMVSRMKTDVSDKSIRYDGDKTVFIDYTEPQNQYSYYRWDEKGRAIEKVGLCCGIQSKMEYDDDDNVVKRTDANGNVTTYTYDDRGNMLSLTDPLGNSERYTYDEKFNQVTSFADKNGNSYRFTYNDKGAMTSLSGPLGFTNTFTYNDKGWPLTTTDANSNVTQTTYNNDGTTASIMDAAGYSTRYSYDAYGNIITLTDAKGNTTAYAYDNNNQITTQTDALGNVTSVSYDKVGNIVRVKNAKNQITAYTYDALGHVLSMTNPAGGTYTYTYDGKGNVLSVTDPMGIKVTQTWNEKNKILSQTNGEGERTACDYDAKGNLTTIFQPNGNVLNYFYDQLDRIEQIADNMGVIAKYTYDANGNQLTITDGLDRTMTYQYDALNRKTSEALPSGATTSYAYDSNSNLLTVTDAKGNATTYTYSSLNQQLTHTDALSAKTVFEYDANGNMSKVTDANGNPTAYTYDALNRNTQITFANGASLQYTYDELGRVVASKDRAGNEFKYTYNALGNLLSKVYPDNTSDRYTYDAISRMLTAVNDAATVTFDYDKAGRMLSETLNGKVTGYKYDVANSKRTLTYPSGMKVEEHLNARDLISSIFQNGEEVVTMEYNVAGQKTRQTYANGITTDYTYNNNGILSSIVDNKNILSLSLTSDVVSNIVQITNNNDIDRSEYYTYDAVSQVIGFKRGTQADKLFEFDKLGNRIKLLDGEMTTLYTVNNVNAYTMNNGIQLVYDNNGNLIDDGMHSYSYDWDNRLVKVDDTEFKYDALRRRIFKNDISYYYLGTQMIEENNGLTFKSYIFGNGIDETVGVQQEGTLHYYHNNHIGSTMALSNSEGKLIESVVYDIYGKPTIYDALGNLLQNSMINNNILFTGREYDIEANLYYYRARSMNPQLGRFMQHDPVLYMDGMNDYSYVLNSPLLFVDFDGYKVEYNDARLLAAAAYKSTNDNVPGWNKVITYESQSGFRGILYEKDGKYVFATSGTDSWDDWKNNFRQGSGKQSDQYDQSLKLAEQLHKDLQDCDLTFVGHSLGGGLASANSRATGRPGVTFNPAALNDRYNKGKNADIDRYVTEGDVLDYANGLLGLFGEKTPFHQSAQGERKPQPSSFPKPKNLPNLQGIPHTGLYQLGRGIYYHLQY